MKKTMPSGFTADFEAIAKGIYAMMDEEYLSALAFGMLPAPLMELAEREFRRKMSTSVMATYGIEITEDSVKPWMAAVRADVVSEFNHELAVAMLGQAKVKKQPPDLTAGEFNRREC